MKRIILISLVLILFYTRFVNLGWGLPYPMHPDERNMAVAIQGMSCELKAKSSKIKECLNPHFYAYGQLPLFLAYGGVEIYHAVTSQITQPTFIEATVALRTISTLASIVFVFVMLRIVEFIFPQKTKKSDITAFSFKFLAFSFFIFQPYAIQFAHFGTTESLLMFFFSLIIYYSLRLLITTNRQLLITMLLGIISGLAIGTKTSALPFLLIPMLIVLIKVVGGTNGEKGRDRIYHFFSIIVRLLLHLLSYLSICLLFFVLSSPHSLLNWTEFINSMNYESAIGLGTYKAFYTRQFELTVPLLFQFQSILPYVLGWPQLIMSALGFMLLPSYIGRSIVNIVRKVARVRGGNKESWRGIVRVTESEKYIDILRFALLISFLPSCFFYAKWTRFIAPSFPIFSLFAILFLFQYTKKSIMVFGALIVISAVSGLAFLSVYSTPDVRFTASEWIYKNIPADSKILSETANVIDLPITPPNYRLAIKDYYLNSFNFYDLDIDNQLKIGLSEALKQADYIIIPSRRIFKNHTCITPDEFSSNQKNCALLLSSYPLLGKYYDDLFSGMSGFEQVAEFASYPRFEFNILNLKFKIPFPDEEAEETWTVFDHPVIRIFKRKTQSKLLTVKTDFTNYPVTDYQLQAVNYRLLVANTPDSWATGLMYVENKKEIRGLDGMIFTFPESESRTFWNKNTLSHLTLYWINNKKVIGISDLPSITETGTVVTVSSPSPADVVIELIK